MKKINKILLLILSMTSLSIAIDNFPPYIIEVFGKPSIHNQNVIVDYAKDKGINIYYNNMGCDISKNSEKYTNNQLADTFYRNKFGKNWLKNIQNEARKTIR